MFALAKYVVVAAMLVIAVQVVSYAHAALTSAAALLGS
jgi:hypothetical protein